MKPIELLRSLPSRLPRRPAGSGGAAGDAWDELDASERSLAGALSWYAGSLALSRDSLSGVRSAILTAAAEAPSAATGSQRSRSRARFTFHQKLAAATAATFMIVVATFGFAAAESGPGQPFYHARLDLEAIGLPPAGSSARLDADMGRSQARLDEITGEAAQLDWNAVADASEAYASVLTTMSVPEDDQERAALKQQVTEQLTRLEGLRANAPESAIKALDKAIAKAEALLEKIERKDKDKDTGKPSPHPTHPPRGGH